MRLPRSLQGRLLALLLSALTLIWIGAALLTTLDARHELDELLDAHLAQAASLLVAQQLETDDDDDRAVDAPSLHKYAPKVAFQVWRGARLALHSSNAPHQAMWPADERRREGFRTVSIGDRRWRVFAARGGEHGVQVYVGEQLSSRSAILRAVLRALALTLALALPLLALAAWWSVRSALRPLRQLRRDLAARQPQALQPVPRADAPAALQPLLDALNALFARIGCLHRVALQQFRIQFHRFVLLAIGRSPTAFSGSCARRNRSSCRYAAASRVRAR